MRRFYILFLAVLAACASAGTGDRRPVHIEGVVTNIDTARQMIYLSVGKRETHDEAAVKYTSLTVVDSGTPGARVEDIQFGDHVLVIGHENIESGEIVADRIGVTENPKPRSKPWEATHV